MNQSRMWTIGAILLIVALLAGTWFLGVAPRLSDANDADTAREQAVVLNNTHRQTLAALQADHERMSEILVELDEAHAVIPEFPELPSFIASIHAHAKRTGVTVTGLDFATLTAYKAPDDAAGDYLATATTLTDGGLYIQPVTITVTGSSAATLNFIAAMQSDQRLLLVHEVQYLNEETESVTTINGQLFGLSEHAVEAPEPTAAPSPPAP